MLDLSNNINLFNGDCLEVMNGIPDGSVDCAVIDPPYKMTKRGKSCRPNWMQDNMGDNVFNGELPKFEDWLGLLYSKMSENSHIYVFTNTVSILEILIAAKNTGFLMHNILTMIKDTGMPNRWYLKQTELVIFLRKGKAFPINDMTSRDWFRVEMPKKSNGKLHITQKPLQAIEMLVSNSSKEGDTVLDCFMGSGTTGVACKNLDRKFIGIELDETYFNIAKERIGE